MPNFIQNGHLLILCLFIIVVSQTILDEKVLILMNLFLVFIGIALLWAVKSKADNLFSVWAFVAIGVAALAVGISELVITLSLLSGEILGSIETLNVIGLSLAMIMCGIQAIEILKETRFR